jgi:hypothetical protein
MEEDEDLAEEPAYPKVPSLKPFTEPPRAQLTDLYSRPFNYVPAVAPNPAPLRRPLGTIAASLAAPTTEPSEVSSARRPKREVKATKKANKKATKKAKNIVESLEDFIEGSPQAPGSINSKASSALKKMTRLCSPPGKAPLEKRSSGIKRALKFRGIDDFKSALDKDEEVKADAGPQYASPEPSKKSPVVPDGATSSFFCARSPRASPRASSRPAMAVGLRPLTDAGVRALAKGLPPKTNKVAKKVSEET